MRLPETLRYAVRALLAHRLRTGLSLLGMVIGVAAVVILTALGEGARLYVVDQFADIGSRLVVVVPGRTETTGTLPGLGGAPNDLTLADAEAIARRVPGAARVAPISMGTETVSHGERRRQVAVVGATASFLEVRRLRLARGDFLPDDELRRGAPVAVLGHRVGRELFPGGDALGSVVRVGGWRMKVIGVLAPRGVQLGADLDEVVVVPVTTGMRLFDRSSLFRVLVEGAPGADLDRLCDRSVALLAERHREEDVTCLTQEAVMSSLSRILRALTLAVGAIAAISLGVAGIGIMNVMLVSVAERTGEIGVLKALGGRSGQVLALFLAEAALLSTFAGVAGIAVGVLGVEVVSGLFPSFPVTPPRWAMSAAFAVSLLVGCLFGVLPARRAARLDPVRALVRR